jgi:hypothetical protein
VNSHQASLYAGGKPAVIGSFARAVRRSLDDTSWVEVAPGWLSGGEPSDPARCFGPVRAASPLDVQPACR